MVAWRVIALPLGCLLGLAAACGPLPESGGSPASTHQRVELDSQCAPPARVRDINPGSVGAFPPITAEVVPELAAAKGLLFFAAQDGTSGQELWRSDGTVEGTLQVKDLRPGEASSFLGNLTPAPDGLFFSAMEGTAGQKPWWTDGTPERMVRLADAPTGTTEGELWELTVVGNRLFFMGYDRAHGNALWMHDRTDGSTVLLKDHFPGNPGTGATGLTALGNRLLFSAVDEVSGEELWISDGTAQGTVMLKNIFELYDSRPRGMVVMNGQAYFSADDDVAGRELWSSDGTAQGTRRVANIWPELADSGPTSLTVVEGRRLFFAAADPVRGRELWMSNGTGAGTELVKDLVPGSRGSHPEGLVAAGDQLFFLAQDAEGRRGLWRTDGTKDGTRWLKAMGGEPGSLPSMLGVGRMLYFAGEEGSSGVELWKSDGTVEGTVQVMDLVPGLDSSHPRALTRVRARLFFVAQDPEAGEELWTLDLCDRAPPQLTCPAAMTIEATSLQGMPVSFTAFATDDVTEEPLLEYSHASGSTFPLGRTGVTITARDEAGNATSCTFPVTVQDTLPPVLTCPKYTFIQASGTGSVEVQYPEVVAKDSLSPVTIAFEPPNGSALPVGDVTPVTVTATDEAGNTTRCQFKIAVESTDEDEDDGSSGCGCATPAGGVAAWAALLLLLAVSRRFREDPS